MSGADGQSANDGRIPITFRFGVTGHRTLKDPAWLKAAVRDALEMIYIEMLPGLPRDSITPIAVSALAEGADRLVAGEVLKEDGSRLEAALPLPPNEYTQDFETADSRQEFYVLLRRSAEIWEAPPSRIREEAYERAGRYVVDRCDALIALWDGEPSKGQGGTGAIVDYARARKVPLVWVNTVDYAITYEADPERTSIIRDAALKLVEYNSLPLDPKDFESQIGAQRIGLGLIPDGSLPDSVTRLQGHVAEWLLPYFVRADALALRLQLRFRRLSVAMFAMAAAAVTVVAIQANFLESLTWLAAIEIVLLLCLVTVLQVNRRSQLYDRWISYRFLAERLRSSYFLTLAGTGDRNPRNGRLQYFSDSSEKWIERALTEVMARRPDGDLTITDLEALKKCLSTNWIGSQAWYHQKTAIRQHSWDLKTVRLATALFGITLVVAFLHALGVGEHGTQRTHLAALLIVLSISLPAIGAAAHGVGAQRQFRSHSDRSARMARLLGHLQQDMDHAGSREEVRELAAQIEQAMREENSDWFGVMRFHDVELIT